MPNMLELIGTRPDRVENYTFSGYEVTARIFLPAFGPKHEPHSWASLAESAGIELTADLRWSQLEPLLPEELRQEIVPAYAQVHMDTAQAMVNAMTSSADSELHVFYAVWAGYRDDRDPVTVRDFPDYAKSILVSHDDLILHQDTAKNFVADAAYRFLRCPVFWWTENLDHAISCPLYSDSLYFSGSRQLFDTLRAHGVEILEISPEALAPHEGD